MAGSIRISPYHIFLNSKREGYTLPEYTPTRYVPQLSIHVRVRSRVHSRAECQAETTKEEAPCAGSGGGYRQTPSGQTHVQNLQAATGGKTWRKVILGGQSINCESIKKQKAGKWPWGRGQSQASSDDGEAGGSLERGALWRLVVKHRMLLKMRTGDANIPERNQKSHQEEKERYV